MLKSYNFHFEFYENRVLPPYYKLKSRDLNDIKQDKEELNEIKIGLILLNPPYLNYKREDLKMNLGCYEKSYWLGFAMDLNQYKNSREYLRQRLGKKSFKNLRQDIQRLEKNHQISFKSYFGSINKSTYDSLMQTLKDFILYRFKGRVHKHAALIKWEKYENSVYNMILNNKASIFVILDNEVPIGISLNYHFKEVLVAAISSFNHNYYPYSLGKQLFVKQIDWCYEHNYRLIDMGWGSFDYKIKFSNAVFKYKTQVIYPKKSFFLKITAFVIIHLLELKYYLVMLRDRRLKYPSVTYNNRWLMFNLK